MYIYSLSSLEEKYTWLSKVASDELRRPLVIEDHEMDRIQHEEQLNKEKAYMVFNLFIYVVNRYAYVSLQTPLIETNSSFGLIQ